MDSIKDVRAAVADALETRGHSNRAFIAEIREGQTKTINVLYSSLNECIDEPISQMLIRAHRRTGVQEKKMANFQAIPTTLRSHALFDVVQVGDSICVESKSDRVERRICSAILLSDIETNPQHYLRNLLPDLRKAAAVALVETRVDGKVAQLVMTAGDWARGAAERRRYAEWLVDTTRKNAAGRGFWDGVNEGGEGYNPYRAS
ncbi:hypothetical protein SAMIE_1015670 [Sphingobium amiense]|uniref:Uncharacterized protein n=1 Tax=Sphingobium amiense TaxID=135719 RepID=A0A494W3Z2_9SPHN|nr:hypothetical protein [Sphingobium amiense]BBD98066.1 hypothetical protein SAMIE_1015670 [Sphingobium amiense]